MLHVHYSKQEIQLWTECEQKVLLFVEAFICVIYFTGGQDCMQEEPWKIDQTVSEGRTREAAQLSEGTFRFKHVISTSIVFNLMSK